ncbi:ABC transporter permease subunit [Fusibacter bizertensis]|uniref:ABC transporter permease subunit n=1 Tax=Fusibacter bizertensis TaxID=1488331 RepID=A0ABT6NDE9_9FIRM|nr:ABC transporter permease subunit [Fusibacter bizertensis]MDH8678450.1 ABC transporter permease subunit [Fusibacter bizertensis]
MLNIFKYEFKMYQKSILVWSITFITVTILLMAFYPSFGSDVAMVDKLLENYPKELLQAFGMGGELSLATVLGYYAFVFAFLQLFIAIQAANYGFSIISVEERELTADYLMSKPVSRAEILLAKFGATFITLCISNGVIWISTLAALKLFNDGKAYNLSNILLLLSTIIIFQLFFLSIGMLVSVLMRKIRSVLSFSLALAFGTYILNSIRAIVGGKLLGYFSPFYHFNPATILAKGSINIALLTLSSFVIIASLTATYLLYVRRDIYSL